MTVTLVIRSYTSQVMSQVILTLGTNVYIVLVMRFSMLYAPPELFGTCGGVQMLAIALTQLVLTPLLPVLGSAFFGQGVAVYHFCFIFLGVTSALAGGACYVYFSCVNFPQPGAVTIAAVKDAQKKRMNSRGSEVRSPLAEYLGL